MGDGHESRRVRVGDEIAAIAAKDVVGLIGNAVELELAIHAGVHAEKAPSGEIVLRAVAEPASAQIIEKEPPALPAGTVEAEDIEEVPGGVELKAEDSVVVGADVVERSERILDPAAEVREIQYRPAF